MNKICRDLESARKRAHTYAAPFGSGASLHQNGMLFYAQALIYVLIYVLRYVL